MGGRGSRGLPAPAAVPLGVAVRAGLGLLHLPGMDTAQDLMASLGGRFAQSGLNRRRRDQTRARIAFAFPEWSAEQVDECAERVWRHLARLVVDVVRAPRFMTEDTWIRHQTFEAEFAGLDDLLDGRPAVCVTAHVGNWELVGHSLAMLGVPVQALYRPLDLAPLDEWMREVRARRGMRLVDKFGAMRRLPAIVNSGALPAIVADQNAGERGEFVPFFGRLASSYRSVASVLMRTGATAIVGGVLRTDGDAALGIDAVHDGATGRRLDELSYRTEIVSAIRPEDWADQPDPAFYITARYRRELERVIRRAPEQYFWMHRMWKTRPAWERDRSGFPAELKEKLLALPWMTADEVEGIVEQSDRDAAELARLGTDRFN